MTILKNCEIWWPALGKPDNSYDKAKPVWKVEIRTTDPKQKEEWVSLGLNPKPIVGAAGKPNEGEAILVNGKKQWRTTLRKKAYHTDKEKEKKPEDRKELTPPDVFDGRLNKVDPYSIRNGTIANIKIFQYPYTAKGQEQIGSVLMGIQLVRHIVRTVSKREMFEETETEVILPEVPEGEEPAF